MYRSPSARRSFRLGARGLLVRRPRNSGWEQFHRVYRGYIRTTQTAFLRNVSEPSGFLRTTPCLVVRDMARCRR